MSSGACVIGVDFGTLSGRAVVVRAADGAELGSAVHEYANGAIERELPASGEPLPPQWALQDPADWIAVLRTAVPAAVAAAGIEPADVIGIGTDFTAATPMPVLRDGTPLCQVPGYETRPHAYPKLWKHHAAQGQADRINALAESRGEPWLARYGGRISSEWEFAKALQLLEEDPEAYAAAERWIEGADWIVWQLCGAETRNRSTRTGAGRPRTTSPPSTSASRASSTRSSPTRCRRSGTVPASSHSRPPAGPGCPRASRWRSATSTRT
jgi:L-ribulokinase